MVSFKYFAFFFCAYYYEGIINGNRIEARETMSKHGEAYTEACNLIFKLCLSTIELSSQ